jgi:surface protein
MYLEDDDATDRNMLKIVSIDFSHFNSIQITDMTKCFSGCKSLESIDFTNFNTENLLDISYMFEDCHLLKSLDLTNFNTEKIEDMSMAFKGCKSLEILDLFNFNTESVINFDEMFRDCESLKFLDISNFHFVGAYNDIFYGAVNLKYINAKNVIVDEYYDLPLYINNNNDLIICQNEGNNHFESFKGLDNIYYFCCTFNTDTDMCESNNYIEVYYNEDCNYVFSNNNRNDIVFINYNDKTFAPSAILNILANTKLQINFDTPITSLEKFFSQDVDEHMNKVVSIDFSHFDSSSLINMDSVFYGCSALKSLNLSTFQTTLVTSMN